MKIIAANLKMNMLPSEIDNFIANCPENIIVAPTSIYIPYFLNKKFDVCLQNIFYEDKGAYTGEISPLQASKMGIKYVLIGHSERRNIFEEKNDVLRLKVLKCLENNLKIIFCVGENLEEKNNNLIESVLKEQLEVLKDFDLNNVIIAYEPVWSIGTGLIPTNQDIYKAISFIKKEYATTVLYGGSVNLENIENLNTDIVDGFLIGGASQDPQALKKMAEIANS